MREHPILSASLLVSAALLSIPSVHAQQWLVNSAINNQIMETAICDSALRKHERLPEVCAKYQRYSSGADTEVTARSETSPAHAKSMKFTLVAGDDAVQKLADSLGGNAQERQQILQIANAGKEVFERKYAGKGWTDDLAGAMAFFIIATHTVSTDREPDAAAQDDLFTSLSATLAQSDLAKASNKDKTALYNALIACAGLPLIFYMDGKQQGNEAELGKARDMAAGFSRKLLNVEPQALAGMLQSGTGGNADASAGTTPVARSAATAGTRELDGRYDCMINAMVGTGASFTIQYRPTGLWFAISGNAYSASSGGGRIEATSGVVGFHGGAYDGWRGARVGDAIVFRKNDYANPQPGVHVRAGDFRCARHEE